MRPMGLKQDSSSPDLQLEYLVQVQRSYTDLHQLKAWADMYLCPRFLHKGVLKNNLRLGLPSHC